MSQPSTDFERLYKENYSRLRGAARNILGDADAAHDVVQEVFVKLWRRREQMGLIVNVPAYLFRSVVNTAITALETKRKNTELSEHTLEADSNSEGDIYAKELDKRIQKALANLPPKCKAIFVLSRFEGLKNREIAEQLSLSLKTVENQMGIALKKLRDDLGPFLKDS